MDISIFSVEICELLGELEQELEEVIVQDQNNENE